jgi:hypothetical protein
LNSLQSGAELAASTSCSLLIYHKTFEPSYKAFIMTESSPNLQGVTAQMRAEMGNIGVKGLMKNKKVFFIAMFAS